MCMHACIWMRTCTLFAAIFSVFIKLCEPKLMKGANLEWPQQHDSNCFGVLVRL